MLTRTNYLAITKFKSSVWGHCLNHFVDFPYVVSFCLCNRARKWIYASYDFKCSLLFWYLCCKCSSKKVIGCWPSYVCACAKYMNSNKASAICSDYKTEDYFLNNNFLEESSHTCTFFTGVLCLLVKYYFENTNLNCHIQELNL